MAFFYELADITAKYPSGLHVRKWYTACKSAVAADSMSINLFLVSGTQRNGILLTGSLRAEFSGDVTSGRMTTINAIPANLPSGPLTDSLTLADIKAMSSTYKVGDIVYANDIGRIGAGNGFGIPIYYDGNVWRKVRDDVTV
jgi:hypothetical protein